MTKILSTENFSRAFSISKTIMFHLFIFSRISVTDNAFDFRAHKIISVVPLASQAESLPTKLPRGVSLFMSKPAFCICKAKAPIS